MLGTKMSILAASLCDGSRAIATKIEGHPNLTFMVLKGLPADFKLFTTVITQKEKPMTFSQFKVALRSYEETEMIKENEESKNIMKFKNSHQEPTKLNYKFAPNKNCNFSKSNNFLKKKLLLWVTQPQKFSM